MCLSAMLTYEPMIALERLLAVMIAFTLVSVTMI